MNYDKAIEELGKIDKKEISLGIQVNNVFRFCTYGNLKINRKIYFINHTLRNMDCICWHEDLMVDSGMSYIEQGVFDDTAQDISIEFVFEEGRENLKFHNLFKMERFLL